jgi:eukaryotic-like serine/threonine-protein kinase
MTSQRTVDYSALERTCGSEKGDPRSDIFFLGCVYYQMLTGKAAMPESESKDMLSKMLKRGLNSIVPLSEHPNAPDPELTRVVEKMMKVELKSRYQSMDDVIADLERFEKRLKSGITGIEEAGGEDDADFLGDMQDLFISNPGAAGPAEKPLGAPAAASESTGSKRKNLLCVESQTDIQNAFRKTLSRMGYRVVLVGDPEVAAERYRESPFDAVIFDVDGLGADSIEALVDMHDKAREDGHDLAALVLLGPKQEALREKLPTDDRLVVLAKPVKMKQVQHAINGLMPSR